MPWNSCLFRKIHMPFTDTRACVFRKGGRGAAGLWQAVPAAMPPLRRAGGGRHEEGVLSCTAFLIRASFTRGRHLGPIWDIPRGSDC